MIVVAGDWQPQRTAVQFGPDVEWFDLSSLAIDSLKVPIGEPDGGSVYAMYARLANEYLDDPTSADRRGGVSGDRYSL